MLNLTQLTITSFLTPSGKASIRTSQCSWSKKPSKVLIPRLLAEHLLPTTSKLMIVRRTQSIQTRTSRITNKTTRKCANCSKCRSNNNSSSSSMNNNSSIHRRACRQQDSNYSRSFKNNNINRWASTIRCSSCLGLWPRNSQTTSPLLKTSKSTLRFWHRLLLMS